MSHARFEVKWDTKTEKWWVLEEDGMDTYGLASYRLKSDAKEHAVGLAKKYNARAGFYSKDPRGEERRTQTRDFR